MNAKEIDNFGKIQEFYFRHNYPIMRGGAVVVFASCCFWLIVNGLNDDIYKLKSSNAVWFILMMVVASVTLFIYATEIKKLLSKEKGLSIEQRERKCTECKNIFLVYYIILAIGVCAIIVARNIMLEESHGLANDLGISLADTLLLIAVLAPFPNKEDAIAVFGIVIITAIVPLYVDGAAYYSVLTEIVLRVGLAFSYFVVGTRFRETYNMQVAVNETSQEMKKRDRQIIKMNEDVVELLADVVELRDSESGAHIQRVKKYTKVLAEKVMEMYPEYELDQHKINVISKASALHDVGKIMIPDEILMKPGRLTKDEFEIMKKHSTYGYDILRDAPASWDKDFLDYSREIALCHHEKYDGKGYPKGLAGDEIPISAQIVSIADCYDALTTERRYKSAYSDDEAAEMIIKGECGAFSNKLLDCFKACREEFAKWHSIS